MVQFILPMAKAIFSPKTTACLWVNWRKMAVIIPILFGIFAFWQGQKAYHSLELELAQTTQALTQAQTDNANLNNQLELTLLQIENYQNQVAQLQNELFAQLKSTEEKRNAAHKALSAHQDWADQSLPNDVIRLFKPSQKAVKTNSAAPLPPKPAVPNAAAQPTP